MSAVLNAALQVSAASIVMASVILLFRAAVRRAVSAKLQYLLWLPLLARLVIPVSFVLPISAGITLPAAVAATAAQTTAAAVAGTGGASVPADMSAAQLVQIILLCVWATGAAALAVFTYLSKRAYNKRCLASAVAADAKLLSLLARCRAELGIKRSIELVVVDGALPPALTTVRLRPVIVMPLSLTDPSERRYAILHELIHYKRKDYLVLALMGALRCVWWFNPVCWLVFPQLQNDMETACDAEVLAGLSRDEKRSYLVTILRMFTYKTQPILGMAQFKTKRLAQMRMRGAFMKTRSKTFAVIAAACICMLLAVGCFTVGCAAGYEVVEVSHNDSAYAPPADMISADAAARKVAAEIRSSYDDDLSGCVVYVDYLGATEDGSAKLAYGDDDPIYITGIDDSTGRRVVAVQRSGQTVYLYLLDWTGDGAITQSSVWKDGVLAS